ncbi:MAG: DUF58 domain-containing protein [Pseudomonadota bacterium]
MRWRFPSAKRLIERLRKGADAKVSRWVRKRQGEDHLPLTLRSKRIYILPTSVGVTFGIVCLAMLLGSMNYNNSMGFALTFMLAAIGLVAMHRCHQNLAGIRVLSATAEPVFAGDPVEFELQLHNEGRSERLDIEAYVGRQIGAADDIPGEGIGRLRVSLPTERRGQTVVERFGIRTRFPMSLLNTWTWMYTPCTCIVWPRPATDAPPRPPAPARARGTQGNQGDDDFAGLRDYRDGDSPRLIAWKTLARSDQLKSRQLSGGGTDTTWIDFAVTPGADLEYRLAVMARWVIDAERAGERFGLRLPDSEITPDQGKAHRDRCLNALALVTPVSELRHA